MAFSMHDYVLHGFKNAIGKQSDYWVILNSAAWAEKGVLTDDDLTELQKLIEERNAALAVTNVDTTADADAEEEADLNGNN